MNYSKAALGICCCFAFLCTSLAAAQERPRGTVDHQLIIDQDGDGFADPGDIVRYTIIVPAPSVPVPGVSLTVYILDSLRYVAGSFDTTQGTLQQTPDTDDPRFIVNLGTLSPAADVIIRYQVRIQKPVGYQEAVKPCSGGFLKFTDGYVQDLNPISGKDAQFGSCVVRSDLDEDSVVDSEDVCLNVPHASPRLDQVIPASPDLNPNLPVSVSNTINIPRRGKITGLSLGILVKHSWVGDLVIKLTHIPSNRTFTLMDRPGINPNNPSIPFGCSGKDIQIADVTSALDSPTEDACAGSAPTIRGTLSPLEPLAPLLNQEMAGDWRLTIEDHFPQDDGGTFVQWCLKPKSQTTVLVSFDTPTQSISSNRFTQRLTIRNSGASDLIDLYPRVLFPFGLHPISAQILGQSRIDLSISPKDQYVEFRKPVGELLKNSSLSIDFDVEPGRIFPYRELVVTTPPALAGTIQSTQASFGPPLSSLGVSGILTKADFSYGSVCDLFNSGALNGKLALLPDNVCPASDMASQVAAAGAIAAIAVNGVFKEFDQIQLVLVSQTLAPVTIPVVSIVSPDYQALSTTNSAISVTLRNPQTKPEWHVTSAVEVFSDSNTASFTGLDSVAISNVTPQQLSTTKILADSDGDGVVDTLDQCALDALKTSPGVCGCGARDIDSDKDRRMDCVDACPSDPSKITVGVCGCGVPDTDNNKNGIVDCRSALEVRAQYRAIQTLLKGVKPFVPSGDALADKKRKQALGVKISTIRRLLREVDTLVSNPQQAIVLKNPSLSILRENRTVAAAVKKALKTSDAKFAENKRLAGIRLTKLIGIIPG